MYIRERKLNFCSEYGLYFIQLIKNVYFIRGFDICELYIVFTSIEKNKSHVHSKQLNILYILKKFQRTRYSNRKIRHVIMTWITLMSRIPRLVAVSQYSRRFENRYKQARNTIIITFMHRFGVASMLMRHCGNNMYLYLKKYIVYAGEDL